MKSLVLFFALMVGAGASPSPPSFGATAAARWDGYVQGLQSQYPDLLQPGCVPRRYKAHGTYKGTVMMYHGFTACPQQFFAWAEILQSVGWDVLLPLTPGHGLKTHVVNGKVEDRYQDFPLTPTPYFDFVDRMNHIMTAVGGQRVVVGLSLGGALATYAGLGRAGNRSIWDRQLILNPFFRISNPVADLVVKVLGHISAARSHQVGFGAGCQKERAAGRAGVCTFTIGIVSTAREFGRIVESQRIRAPAVPEATQVVYDIHDPVVSVPAIHNVYILYGQPVAGKSICQLPSAVGHSFLSPFDNPTQNKFWLVEATCRLSSFVTGHGFVPAVASGSPYPNCALDCTAASCPYTHRLTSFTCPSKYGPISKRLGSRLPSSAVISDTVRSWAHGLSVHRGHNNANLPPQLCQDTQDSACLVSWECFLGCAQDRCNTTGVNISACWQPCLDTASCQYSRAVHDEPGDNTKPAMHTGPVFISAVCVGAVVILGLSIWAWNKRTMHFLRPTASTSRLSTASLTGYAELPDAEMSQRSS